MTYSKILSLLFLLAVGLWFLPPIARAEDNAQRRTKLTLTEPTEIPGTVLQPGSYTVTVLDYKDEKEIVQFLNEDETKVVATVLAIRDRRARTDDGQTGFVYFQRVEGNPIALKSWYYSGDEWGELFAYPRSKAVVIAKATHETVVAIPAESKPTLQTEVVVVKPEEAPNVAPEPAPEPAAPVAEKTPAHLPKTGSHVPLVGVIGLWALAGGAVLHLVRRKA